MLDPAEQPSGCAQAVMSLAVCGGTDAIDRGRSNAFEVAIGERDGARWIQRWTGLSGGQKSCDSHVGHGAGGEWSRHS